MKEKWIGGNWMNRYKVPLASSQSFLEEIKRCLYLLPAWERVLLEGRERPKVVGRPHLNGPWLHAICSIFWQRHMEDQTAFLSMKKKTQISCHQSQSNNVVIDCLTAVLYGRLRVEPFKNRLAKEPGTGRRSVHALLLTDNIRRHLITNICNNGLFGVFARRSSVKYALGIVHVYDHLRNNAVLRPYMQRQQAQWEKNRDTLEELAISVYEWIAGSSETEPMKQGLRRETGLFRCGCDTPLTKGKTADLQN